MMKVRVLSATGPKSTIASELQIYIAINRNNIHNNQRRRRLGKSQKPKSETTSKAKIQLRHITEGSPGSDSKSTKLTVRQKSSTSLKLPEQKKLQRNRKFLLTTMAEAASVGDIGLFGWTNASGPIGIFERRKLL